MAEQILIDNPWEEYEKRKKEIAEVAKTHEEYEKMIAELCKKLNI